ncbi:Protocadherin gamma-A10 [Oopsacas minuta]|uniref:Protocadherin gamma-A10 n=1 Tax=Oopsacas minuta TaxID=111878 RepID=A0AAV7K742_9METZ|nr:Protocadherin gamma-A10 [Oopsacas minuta]
MSDSATITISINDLNDNVPRFEFPSYNVTVDEDFSTSETLIQVHAFESPEDANTRITYSLQNKPPTSDDSLEYITIDSGTGIITASKSLDFEDLAVLELTITASDGINPATVGLTIYVENINDNAPSLTISSSCSQTLPENRPLGVFCTLDVLDLDQNSSTPEFTLESSGFSISPPLTKFAIVYSDGSSTASVQLQSLLDFESEKSYPLVITQPRLLCCWLENPSKLHIVTSVFLTHEQIWFDRILNLKQIHLAASIKSSSSCFRTSVIVERRHGRRMQMLRGGAKQ